MSETDILDGLAFELWTSDSLVARMSKRSRERQLAKLAARRQAERDAKRRRRATHLGAFGIVVAMACWSRPARSSSTAETSQASPSPTVSPSGSPSASPSPTPQGKPGTQTARSIRSPRRRRSRAAPRPEEGGQGQAAVRRSAAHEDRSPTTYIAAMETSCGTIVIDWIRRRAQTVTASSSSPTMATSTVSTARIDTRSMSCRAAIRRGQDRAVRDTRSPMSFRAARSTTTIGGVKVPR